MNFVRSLGVACQIRGRKQLIEKQETGKLRFANVDNRRNLMKTVSSVFLECDIALFRTVA